MFMFCAEAIARAGQLLLGAGLTPGTLTFAALAGILAVSALGQEARPAVSVQRDILFARVAERPLLLDYYPAQAGVSASPDHPQPLIIWVHGGAWRAGSRSDVPVIPLTHLGFAVASVDYRLSPEARFPAQVQDLQAAIRFLRLHCRRFGVDPERFAIAGASAGGHLAALAGVVDDQAFREGQADIVSEAGVGTQSSRVQAIVSFYGASNLQTILSQSTPHGLKVRVPALDLLLGPRSAKREELARLASPVTHVDRSDPALLLIHGDQDPQMPIQQSHELQAAYQRVERPVEFHVVAGGRHGGPEFFDAPMLHRVNKFLNRSLKREGAL